ncbi:MAG: SUMF1/EgtB/PvdO family nonheme iron enzyme [Candidatus Latescibacteria bacterium]|nr:SUMF1/EgtB/PvdO family nonheme iron enzyme [Candidatus Latescibacterota bacterium]
MEMVWIEAGVYMMGTSLPGALAMGSYAERRRYVDEGPQHEVTISRGFWLGKYELTQGQWEAVMGTRPWVGQDHRVKSVADHPAVYISWDDAQAFAARLNQAAGDSLYRLPTEAEWEYACRAGTSTRWSFGDDESLLGGYAWYRDNVKTNVNNLDANPVGQKKPNPWGLYDMYGNAWEWCLDWYGYYLNRPQVDPTGPPTGTQRVRRGGGFRDWKNYVYSVFRGNSRPGSGGNSFGARILRMAPARATPIAPQSWGQLKSGASSRKVGP